MSDPLKKVSAPPDAKGRLISIFVGAVLLPSIALSVVSFYMVPRHAESMKITLYRRAETYLKYIEADLERTAREKALEAARALGTERLLDGHPEVIRVALREAGLGDNMFEDLRLEAASRTVQLPGGHDRELEILRDTLHAMEAPPRSEEEEEVLPLSGADSKLIGVLHFRYSCDYAHGKLLHEFFANDVTNPDQTMVIRVTEPPGTVLYESAPTPENKFEVKRVMTSPSFRGLKLLLRYKDRSIEQEVHRLAIGKMVLIAFIDLMLGAGLYLVYSNVRREMHLSRLKSDFVANVSHELKTPLALIRLFAETLEMGRVPGEEKAKQYYRVINKESQRLTQLINNILDFSKIEAGGKQYRFAPTDLSRVVRDVLDAYRFQIEQQGFSLDVQLAEDVPEVSVDPEAIGQAVINLVNNAIKYSRDEKHIRIELRRDGDRVLLSVADKGIGVKKAEQRKIFEKFYRGEDSLVHDTKGSGLGLALVRHIMEAHGGEVQVESAPGKGSTFTLIVPVKNGNGGAA